MTDRELMQQALESLENTTPTGFNMESDKRFYAAITALRERLAQPEQEPVAWLYRDSWGTMKLSQIMPPPVGAFPVYTTPPRREWVGLTEGEFDSIRDTARIHCKTWKMVTRAIEAKLKEKNS